MLRKLRYEEQLDILRSRNLIIDDVEDALGFLKKVNYYRFSAYGLTLKQKDNRDLFQKGITFHRIKMIYTFDQKLRSLLMNYLEYIEIEFRSRIAYYHSHKYGSLGYKESANFLSESKHEIFLKQLQQQIDRSRSQLFVMHHKRKYKGEFPFWVAIEVISFGELSKVFRNLLKNDKKEIVKSYKISSYYIESWLHTLSYIRNVCAHYGRLYGKRLVIAPMLPGSERSFNNKTVFAAIYILSRLLHIEELTNFITSLNALLEQYETYITYGDLGFPEKWESLLLR